MNIEIPNILFDSFCRLKELDPKTVESLPPERLDRYEQVRAAATIAEADEVVHAAATRAERWAETDLQFATAALLKRRPKVEFLDCLRAAQAAYRSQNS